MATIIKDPTGQLKPLYEFLKSTHPRDLLIPVPLNEKRPIIKYGGGAWTAETLHTFLTTEQDTESDWALTLHDLVCIDIDDPALRETFEAKYPCLTVAPMEQTRRGFHYFFLRSPLCDAQGYYDCSGGVTPHVDFKTECSTGTGGILVVCPSTDKTWIRPLWSTPLVPIPDDLLAVCAKPSGEARVATAKQGKQGQGQREEEAGATGGPPTHPPTLPAPAPLPPTPFTSPHVLLHFLEDTPGSPPLPIATSRLSPLGYFTPLLSGRWGDDSQSTTTTTTTTPPPTTPSFTVPIDRLTFSILMCVLETGDLPPHLPPTDALLHAIHAAGDLLALSPEGMECVSPPARPTSRLAFRSDLYSINPAWWRVDTEEEARMKARGSGGGGAGLVKVDVALAGVLLYAPLPKDSRWLFQHQPRVVADASIGRQVLVKNPPLALGASLPPLLVALLKAYEGVMVCAGGAVGGEVGSACQSGSDYDLFLHSLTAQRADGILTKCKFMAKAAGYTETASLLAVTFHPPAPAAAPSATATSPPTPTPSPSLSKPIQVILCLHDDAAQVLESFDLAPCKALVRWKSTPAPTIGGGDGGGGGEGVGGGWIVEATPSWVESMRTMAFWVDPTVWSASATVRICKYVAKGFEACMPGIRRGAFASGASHPLSYWGGGDGRRQVVGGDFTLVSLYDAEASHVYGNLAGGGQHWQWQGEEAALKAPGISLSINPNRLTRTDVKAIASALADTGHLLQNNPKERRAPYDGGEGDGEGFHTSGYGGRGRRRGGGDYRYFWGPSQRDINSTPGSLAKREVATSAFFTALEAKEALEAAAAGAGAGGSGVKPPPLPPLVEWNTVRGVARFCPGVSKLATLHDKVKLLAIVKEEVEGRGKREGGVIAGTTTTATATTTDGTAPATDAAATPTTPVVEGVGGAGGVQAMMERFRKRSELPNALTNTIINNSTTTNACAAAKCSVTNAVLICSGCHVNHYCCVEHQKADRSAHKASCNAFIKWTQGMGVGEGGGDAAQHQ